MANGAEKPTRSYTVAASHPNGEQIVRHADGTWWIEKPDGPPHTLMGEWAAGRYAASLGFDIDEDFPDAEAFHAGRRNDRSKLR